jgi:hypothetical protein
MWLPRPMELFAGRDLHEIEIESLARLAAQRQSSAPTQAPVPAVPDDHRDALAIKMLSIGGAPSHPPPAPVPSVSALPAVPEVPSAPVVPEAPAVPSVPVDPSVSAVPSAPPVPPAPAPKSSADINVKEPNSGPAVNTVDVLVQVNGHDKGQEGPEARSPTPVWTNGLVSEPLNIEIKVSQLPVLHQDPDSHVIVGETQVSFSGT